MSSSSETPIATAITEQEYAIHSKNDTPPDVFKSFIDELDGGKGHLYIWEALGGQLYITLLNAAQAKELPENHDFIEYVFRNTIAEAFEGDEASRVTQSVQAGNEANPVSGPTNVISFAHMVRMVALSLVQLTLSPCRTC